MDDVKDTKSESWYSKILSNITSMSDQLELESEQRETLREFVLSIAKDQYCAGNKAGIRWLRVQMLKEASTQTAAA
ncbi:MAG: hypothetical protein AAB865_02685 [Patescibacteria group bacterium]